MTTWSPDTCGCRIDEYDSPAARFDVRCERHKNMTPAQVLEENQGKNRVANFLDDERIPAWIAFDADNTLVVQLPAGTDMARMQGKIAKRAGNRSVRLTSQKLQRAIPNRAARAETSSQ